MGTPALSFETAPLTSPKLVLPAPRITRVSYSSLAEYERCGYRFYLERVLGIPGREDWSGQGGGGGARERGILAHALLEDLDFKRARIPTAAEIMDAADGELAEAGARELADLIEGFLGSGLYDRLAACPEVGREQRFSFLLHGELLITGALDVLAREPDGAALVVDYKSDRLAGEDPAAIVARAYTGQRLIYALAALRAGAREVEVAHVFLESPDAPVQARFNLEDVPRLEAELGALAAGIEREQFAVAPDPHRALCHGCPAEGGLCSWPVEMTRREVAVVAEAEPEPPSEPGGGFVTQTLF